MAEKSTKHTPGPWHWTNFGGSEMLVTKHSGSLVVLCAGKNKHHMPEICTRIGIPSRLVSLQAGHPDAQLIAKSPEMLTALKSLVDAIEHPDRMSGQLVDSAVRLIGEIEGNGQ